MEITKRSFGMLPDGSEADLYTLSVGEVFKAEITNFGGVIMSLWTPDRHGSAADIVLGFDDLQGYVNKHPYFGSIVGRYGNRIAGGGFVLDGVRYTLAINNGPNHLHGGLHGFDKALWKAEPQQRDDAVGLRLCHVSQDGDEGYPGSLECEVVYWLTKGHALEIHYSARTDAPTHVNLTNHSYFNLNGHDAGDILGHEMTLFAEYFVPVSEVLIPTGQLQPVENTPLDFRTPTVIGARINFEHEQLRYGLGYDHTFVIDAQGRGELRQAAAAYAPESGRVMEVETMEPGVQFYTGNFLDGSNVGKGGVPYQRRNGFCLETQHFPDSPNQPQFPSTVLRPGVLYQTATIYHFSTR